MKGIKLPEKWDENYLQDEGTLKLIDWIKCIKLFMEIYQFSGFGGRKWTFEFVFAGNSVNQAICGLLGNFTRQFVSPSVPPKGISIFWFNYPAKQVLSVILVLSLSNFVLHSAIL